MATFVSEARADAGSALGEARLPLAARLGAFAVLSLLGNLTGATLQYPEIGAAVLYPPYAILTAALVVDRRRRWPWYLLVAVVTHVATHWPRWSLSWVLMADVANVARALTAAILLHALLGGIPRLRSIGALVRFVLAAVLVAPAVGAAIGATSAVLHGASPSFWLTWRAWFVSNALTGVTLLPALVAVFTHTVRGRAGQVPAPRLAEALLLAAAVAATCLVAFHPPYGLRWRVALPFYSSLPVLIWAALRFGPRGASLALSAVAFAAIWGADRGTGPFLASSPDENVILVQTYLLLTALPLLCIAIVNGARESSVRLYRALLSSMHDHVAILDVQGVIIDVNDSWRRFAESLLPEHRLGVGDDYVAACRHAAARGSPAAQQALAGVTSILNREERRFEIEYEREGQPEFYVLTMEALERADGGAVVTRTDITARRRAQLELEEQRRELAHLARAAVLGQISGALAHELNQPLSAILSNANAARRLLAVEPVDRKELTEILEDIASEDRRAADFIRNLRAFFKRGETDPQALDSAEVVAEVLQLAHEELITRGVVATSSVDPGVPPVRGDRVQLQQVLLNLILNGCEAMSGTARADRRLSLVVRADDGYVHFAVRDRGMGIDPAVADRLFEPFVTTKSDGLGLGLSISRTIVSAHGGTLWAENNADRGATVHCRLPGAEPLEAAAR
jgi:signal transduction histidine kinase